MAVTITGLSSDPIAEAINLMNRDALEKLFKEDLMKRVEPVVDELVRKILNDMLSQIDIVSVFKEHPTKGFTYTLEIQPKQLSSLSTNE